MVSTRVGLGRMSGEKGGAAFGWASGFRSLPRGSKHPNIIVGL